MHISKTVAETLVEERISTLRVGRSIELAGYLEAIAAGESLPSEILDQAFPIDDETDCALGCMSISDLQRIAIHRLAKATEDVAEARALAGVVESICARMSPGDGDTLGNLAA